MPVTGVIGVRKAQRGSLLIAAVVLIVVVGFLGVALTFMVTGSLRAGADHLQSAQALYLAESGLERVARRLAGTACGAGLMEGPVAFGGGQFEVVAPIPSVVGGQCQVRVAGTVQQSTRTIDGWFSGAGGTIVLDAVRSMSATTSSLSFSHPVAAGASILVVGVSLDRANTVINNVSYAGQLLTQLGSASSGNRPEASIWYLLNPPAGTANVVVSLGANEQVAAGAISFLGVDTTTPFDTAITPRTGNSTTATAPVTPVTGGAWIFDVMAVNNNNNVTPTAAGQVQRWEYQVSGQVSGAASTIGPVNPAALTTPRWTWIGNDQWAHAAVALQPGGSPQLVFWSEVIN